jgi:hypothetical protein
VTPVVLAVALTPPTASGYAVTQFPAAQLAPGAAADFSLPTPRRLVGTVRAASNPLEESVPAMIEARAEGDIAGTEYNFSATSRKVDGAGEGRGFELLVAPTSRPYSLTVLPDNLAFPSFHLPPRAFHDDEENLVITMPALDSFLRIEGRMVTNRATGEPLQGVRLVAFSNHSSNLSPTVDVASDGAFTLTVPPTDEPESYRVVLQPRDAAAAIPALTIEDDLLVAGHVDLGDLELPALPAKRDVVVTVRDSENSAVADVDVRCHGPVGGGTLASSGATNSEGRTRLVLRRGTYSCAFLPSTGGPWGATRVEFELTAASAERGPVTWDVVLARKPRLYGRLMAHGSGLPVADVTVVAVHIDMADPLFGREVSATSDAEGRFQVHLESGAYALIASPPPGAGQAVRIIDELFVQGDTAMDIVFPPVRLVTGTVRGAMGTVWPGCGWMSTGTWPASPGAPARRWATRRNPAQPTKPPPRREPRQRSPQRGARAHPIPRCSARCGWWGRP